MSIHFLERGDMSYPDGLEPGGLDPFRTIGDVLWRFTARVGSEHDADTNQQRDLLQYSFSYCTGR